MARRLREEFVVSSNQVLELHAIVIRVLAGMKNVAIQVDCLFAVRQDGRDMDFVAVLNVEVGERTVRFLRTIGFRKIDPKHGPALVSDDSFYLNVTKRSRSKDATGKFQNLGQLALSAQFINRRPTHQAFDCDFSPEWRDLN